MLVILRGQQRTHRMLKGVWSLSWGQSNEIEICGGQRGLSRSYILVCTGAGICWHPHSLYTLAPLCSL